MATIMNLEFLCPRCRKPVGYHFTRNGFVYPNEIIGRFAGNFITCQNCKQKISIAVMLKINKKREE